jgi:outer membrane protein assembly factor BamD
MAHSQAHIEALTFFSREVRAELMEPLDRFDRRQDRMASWIRAWALLFVIALVAGCAAREVPREPTAEENYQMGMEKFDKKDYRDAIPYYQKILENYPFSYYAIQAELKIAEAYFLDKKYVEALVHLHGFQELHPTNENIPYVLWMKAVSYSEQFRTIDRDVSSMDNSKRELLELTTRFPESPYAEEAQEMLVKVNGRLAEHDFYVAHFYYRSADYYAALKRFQRILDKYPIEGVADRALYCIGKCYYFLREDPSAREAFSAVVDRYPDSPYRSKAEAFLRDLEGGRFTRVSRFFRFKERVFYMFGYE